MSIVGIFILFIACINFTNLLTARSLQRAKEIGIRKVIGAVKRNLVFQFLGEAMLYSSMGMLVALGLLVLILPWFNELVQKQIHIPWTHSYFLGLIMGVFFIVSILSGAYPALFLSSFRPIAVLKGVFARNRKGGWVQKGLIIFQFSLSACLIIATIVISQQTAYLQNKYLGYDKENILYLPVEGELKENYRLFKDRLTQMPGIQLVDRSSQTPHQMGLSLPCVRWEGMNPDNPPIFTPSSVGYDFVELMGMEMLEGRDFSEEFSTDDTAFVINALGVKEMGLENPIGTTISVFGKRGPIIGIVDNFHTQSLHEALQPVVLDLKEGLDFGTILVKSKPGELESAIASVETLFSEMNPGYAFDYSFLDLETQKQYQSEQLITQLSNVFGALAILIACLGLLGLSMFAAERRIKEVGIRKVLGASMSNIVGLLSKDFLLLVIISFVIASPIAWYAMQNWLEAFAYRIDIRWWVFILAGFLLLGLSFITVATQGIKSANVNPVVSLREE